MRFIALLVVGILLGACVVSEPPPRHHSNVRPMPHPSPHPTVRPDRRPGSDSASRPDRRPRPEPIVRPDRQSAPHPVPRDRRSQRDERRGCDAAQYRQLVGSRAPDPFPHRGPVRVYHSGVPVTMDHNPNRLNVEVHPRSRRIVSITCG